MNPTTPCPAFPSEPPQRRRLILSGTLAGLLMTGWAGLASDAQAQAYPDRPVKIVVSSAAGGALDVTARQLAEKLSGKLGQTFIIENRAGAGGVLGATSVAKAAADGYTLLFVSAGYSTLPALHPNLPFSHADLTPVGVAVSVPFVLVAAPNAPYKTLPELVAYAKANPGKLNIASGGNATAGHLLGAWFKSEAKVDLLHIPFKGEGPGLQAMLGDQISVMPVTTTSALPLLKAGKLRALAISSPKRSKLLPEVPTISEQGVPVQSVTWFGMMAPASTPPEVIRRLNAAINDALNEPDLRDKYQNAGMEVGGGSEADFKKLIEVETAHWGRLIKQMGIVAE